MNCPHCNKALPVKTRTVAGEAKYREDVAKAWKALGALERVLGQSHEEWIRNGLVPMSNSFAVFRMAVEMEMERLLAVVDQPERLYAIYRRADKKTPVAYGMVSSS